MRLRETGRVRPTARRAAERLAVESCLARWGLLDRPRPRSVDGAWAAAAPVQGETAGAPFGRRLRGALEELGPVFSAFGLYLASRVDLLTAADCLQLSAISDRVPPLPIAAVRERITAELGQPADAVLAALDPEPCESRLPVQGHRALLRDGQPVVLWVARQAPAPSPPPPLPPAAAAPERDLDRLPWLAPAFARHGWSGGSEGWLGAAIMDFRRALREAADLAATAEALSTLAADAASFGMLAPPAVHRDLSTPGLLVVGDPGGTPLGVALAETAAGQDGAGGAGAAGRDDARRRELARLICVTWLRQALEGRVFAVDLPAAGVRVLGGGRLAFLAVTFSRPPAADRANLRGFLVAMAAREPDEACSFLLRESTREGPEASEETLRLQWRQVVPFRDGAWSAAGTSLAEHVFVCARQACACGFRPRPQLLAFYRGLAGAAAAARQLTSRGKGGAEDARRAEVSEPDVLLEALQEVRVLAGFSQVREAMSPPWAEQWGRYAMMMSELPRKLDELLTVASENVTQTSRMGGDRPARPEEGSLLVAGALMVLAALALLLRHFSRSGALAGRGEAVGAALFLAVGGFLLWTLARGR